MRQYLFNTEKIKYILGEKPNVECILCEMVLKNPNVSSLVIYESELSIVTVNLYPFNPGHLMIFPKRHVTNYEDLADEESADIDKLLKKSAIILKEHFNPNGFNIGYNIGNCSGASISHLHAHIVPRYQNEVGFIDVLAGDRVVVVDPAEVLEMLKSNFIK